MLMQPLAIPVIHVTLTRVYRTPQIASSTQRQDAGVWDRRSLTSDCRRLGTAPK